MCCCEQHHESRQRCEETTEQEDELLPVAGVSSSFAWSRVKVTFKESHCVHHESEEEDQEEVCHDSEEEDQEVFLQKR